MNEERMKVLELLSAGKINTEEAIELIKGLEDDSTQKSKAQSNGGINFDWIRDLQENVMDTIQDLSFDVNEDGWFFGLCGRLLEETTLCSGNITQDITSLRLVGKNGNVEVTGSHEDHLIIDASYRTRSSADARLMLEEENGSYRVSYDENAVVFMKLKVRVPLVKIGALHLESKNAQINVRNLNFNKAYASTKNATISMAKLTGGSLIAKTKNAMVALCDINTEVIDINTTNAKVELESVTAQAADLQTTNGSIRAMGTDIREIIAKTTNASVKLTPVISSSGDYCIDTQTTNGSITVTLPNGGDIPCKLKASTTNGKIKTNIPKLTYSVKSKNYIDAKTEYCEQCQSTGQLTMLLNTTNSDIKIGCHTLVE